MSDILDWKTGEDLRKVNDFTFVEVANTLFDAADLVERQGWTRKRMFGPLDRETGVRQRCARGALADACDVYSQADGKARRRALMDVAEGALRWWLIDQGAEGMDPSWFDDMIVPEWNDADGRTQQDVVAALRGCAEWVKAGDDGIG